MKYLQKKLQQQLVSFEEMISQNDEKFEEVSKKYEISRKTENELRDYLKLRNEEINGLKEVVDKLTSDSIKKQEQLSIHFKQYNDQKIIIKKLEEEISELNNELRDKEKIKKDLVKYKSLNGKLSQYNEDLEKENIAQSNAVVFLTKEKTEMVNMVRGLIYYQYDLTERSFSLSKSNHDVNPKKQKKTCPINGCTGVGHINGKSKRHCVYVYLKFENIFLFFHFFWLLKSEILPNEQGTDIRFQ